MSDLENELTSRTTGEAAIAKNRVCIDCVHIRQAEGLSGSGSPVRWYDCRQTRKETKPHIVTGEVKISYETCWDTRKNEDACGMVGKWF